MSLWAEFNDKYGFDDGADEMMIHRLIRDRTVELLNGALPGSSGLVYAAYDRPGLHNSCMIVGGAIDQLTRPPMKDTDKYPFPLERKVFLRNWPDDVPMDPDLLERLEYVGFEPSTVTTDMFCEAVTKLASAYVNAELYEAYKAAQKIQRELWVHNDPEDKTPKEWSSDTPANIAEIMTYHGFGDPTKNNEEE